MAGRSVTNRSPSTRYWAATTTLSDCGDRSSRSPISPTVFGGGVQGGVELAGQQVTADATFQAAPPAVAYHHAVTHTPTTIGAGVPPYAVALAEHGRAGRLVIYSGAGLSRAEPAGLPTGAEVAQRLYHRLRDAFPAIDGVDEGSLTAVADAVAVLDHGDEALRFTAVQVAEFTTATPTYGHRVLALLLLEGIVDALTTNWDDCVERGGGFERVSSVVTEHDLLHVAPKSVLKIHGCATQPSSLLVTSADLHSPPTWVVDQTRARLGTSVVVFVGIGDVAGYVQERLKEAISDVGNVGNIRVVSPDIGEGWVGSQWAALVPGLTAERRFAETADAFLEKLGAAYVHITLAAVSAGLQDEAALATAFDAASSGLRQHDALTVLEWARHAGVVARAGAPVLSTEAMAEALVAVGGSGHQDHEGLDTGNRGWPSGGARRG